MYVCVCKGLTDRDIRQGVLRGEVSCMDSLRSRLGASTGCGSCEFTAQECLEEALAHKSRLGADQDRYDALEDTIFAVQGELSPA